MKPLYALLMMLGLSFLPVSGHAKESGAQLECAKGDEQCLQQQEKQKQVNQEQEPECE